MEQREVIHKLLVRGPSTMANMIGALLKMSHELKERYHLSVERNAMMNEQKLYKLLNQSDPVTKEFLRQGVDLEKVRECLRAHHIPFAFNETNEGVNLYFKVKDEQLVLDGLSKLFNELRERPQETAQRMLKVPGKTDFKEKIEKYHKAHPELKNMNPPSLAKVPTKGV